MESSSIEEQTPEEKLVDELVGIGMQIEGKVREDVPLAKQREIKSAVKKIWVNGASCEEIEETYYEYVKNSIDLEDKGVEDSKFSKNFSDFGTNIKKELKKIDFNFIHNANIKDNALNWWKDIKGFEYIQKNNNGSSKIILNKKNNISYNKESSKENNRFFNKTLNKKNNRFFNDTLAKKFRRFEKNEFKSPEFQSSINFDEEKHKQEDLKENLVDELVGLGPSFGKELNSLDILNIYKLSIKSTIQFVWKEGGSIDQIQKTYDDLVTKFLDDKIELENHKLLKMELEELKKESLIKKELENEKLKFEGYIQEIKKDFQNGNEKEFYCNTLLEDNTILIEKKKPVSKNFCGENKILYLDILSAIYEKENPQNEYIQIYTKDFIFKLINKNRDKNLKDFYDKLMEKINKEKRYHVNNIQKEDKSTCSNADELMKWYELKEKGVITPEEFENKKNKLL
ncbi:MAG: SHOCT domain-containing protein [Methanobacteriaceae archaeon]|jgi:hypothetical protein|nr:SHOCT domain-containing protein [Candidatus Methanorudis spinitermitis]